MNRKGETTESYIFAFGTPNDSLAWEVADRLDGDIPDCKFIKTDDPVLIEDENILNRKNKVIIMDAVRGINHPTTITISDLFKGKTVTTHDIDLGMTLKLLEKTGKINNINVKIIGLPIDSTINERFINKVKSIVESTIAKQT